MNFENKIRIGCDIVDIKRIEKLKRDSLLKIFYESEIKNKSNESIAGLIAVKESCRKVFNMLEWKDIVIKKMKTGKPVLNINSHKIKENIISSDLSISHDGNYAISAVIFLLK